MKKSEKPLVPGEGESLQDPYKAKGSDFTVKKASGKDADGDTDFGSKESKKEEKREKRGLTSASVYQDSPRALESCEVDGPSEWGKGGKAFVVGTASEGSTSLADPCGVDCELGYYTCSGHARTKAQEVPDPKLSIG